MPPQSDFERELHVLESELRRLEAEYNSFFAGRAARLPWEQRARVDAMMKRFDRQSISNTGDRFRFQTLQARWASFTELWERQLRAQETGRRPIRDRRAGAPVPSVPAPPDPPEVQAARKDHIVAVASLSDPASQQDRVRMLYEQLTEARRAAGEKPVGYDAFSTLVRAQVSKLAADGGDVTFRVAVKDGKVTLSAERGEDS